MHDGFAVSKGATGANVEMVQHESLCLLCLCKSLECRGVAIDTTVPSSSGETLVPIESFAARAGELEKLVVEAAYKPRVLTGF